MSSKTLPFWRDERRGQELSQTLLSGRLTDSSRTSPSLRSKNPTGREIVRDYIMMRGNITCLAFFRIERTEWRFAV